MPEIPGCNEVLGAVLTAEDGSGSVGTYRRRGVNAFLTRKYYCLLSVQNGRYAETIKAKVIKSEIRNR
jgi:hypothetical protein